jgi:hypothetical protein
LKVSLESGYWIGINDVPHELYGVAHLPEMVPLFSEFLICGTIDPRFSGKLKKYYSVKYCKSKQGELQTWVCQCPEDDFCRVF